MVYAYKCACENKVDLIRAIADRDKEVICKVCRRPMERMLTYDQTFLIRGGQTIKG